jgi:hypothetical protein
MLSGTMHEYCKGKADHPNEIIWSKLQGHRSYSEEHLCFYRRRALEV